MINLNALQLENVEFSDCKLNYIKLDVENRKFNIEMEEIYLIKEKKYLGNISFIGDKYDNLSITCYNSISKEKRETDSLEPINEILEIKRYKDIIIFCGFGSQSGDWIEISFKSLIYHFEQNSPSQRL